MDARDAVEWRQKHDGRNTNSTFATANTATTVRTAIEQGSPPTRRAFAAERPSALSAAANVPVLAPPGPVAATAPVPVAALGLATLAGELRFRLVAVGRAPRARLVVVVAVLTSGVTGNALHAVATPLAHPSRVTLALVEGTLPAIAVGPLRHPTAGVLSLAAEALGDVVVDPVI